MTTTTAAETIFHGGRVHTVDDARPTADAVAVHGGRIVAVGGDADVLALAGSRTRVIDLRGRTLLPGFQDAHVHPVTAGLDRLRCDLSTASDAEALPASRRRLRRSVPRAAGHRRRRLGDGRLPGWHTVAAAARRDRRRPAGHPREPRRPRQLGQHHGAAPGRHRCLDARPERWAHRARCRRVARRAPCTKAPWISSPASSTRPSDEEWLEGARIGQAELHRLGITAWQEASGNGAIMGAYRRLAEAGA